MLKNLQLLKGNKILGVIFINL